MGWRERLQPAQFRGVAFHVEGSSRSGGRRVSVLKFAGRDGSEQQDHGGEPAEFDVVGYIFGEDYDLDRNDLESAIEAEGPAALTIPTRGDLWVRVTRGPITTEHQNEGGYCAIRFSVIIEDREAGSRQPRVDTRSELVSSSANLRKAAAADFAARVDTKSLPERYLENALGAVRGVTTTLKHVQRITHGLLSPVTTLTAAIDEFDHTANALLSTPDLFATQLLDLVFSALSVNHTLAVGIERGLRAPLVLLSAFDRGAMARQLERSSRALRGLGEPIVSVALSALGRRAEENAISIYRLTRAGALAAQAESYASAEFDSASFALGTLERTIAEIDAVCRLNTKDELHRSLADLRAKLGRHILETASKLPQTITHRAPQPVPSLLLAYELYGDPRMAADIVARNGIAHPLSMQGAIEVLEP
jgi:prophage DNA circulation protein